MDQTAPLNIRQLRDARIRHDVSCTVITFNEADRIRRCIESVRGIVSEIIVVDSGSTDGTQEVCRSLGARVIHNPWPGYGPQKRFAEDAASHDWIFNLDADEWLNDGVRAELISILSQPISPDVHGFRFHIKTVYPGAAKPRLWADEHNYVRLYDKRACRFPDSLVHDEVKLARPNRVQVRKPIYHETIRSISHLVEKNLRYFKLQKREIPKNPALVLIRLPFEYILTLFKYYFIRRHFTGGIYGFALASTIAYLRTYRLLILGFGEKSESSR